MFIVDDNFGLFMTIQLKCVITFVQKPGEWGKSKWWVSSYSYQRVSVSEANPSVLGVMLSGCLYMDIFSCVMCGRRQIAS